MGRGGSPPREDGGGGGRGAVRSARSPHGMAAAPPSPPAPPAPPFGRFFLPGPTDVHPEVLAAMQRPMIGHRSGAMEQLLAGMAPGLARLFRTTRTVLVGTTSATGFMELAVDRKSTRLNSSHLVISYAVFCL